MSDPWLGRLERWEEHGAIWRTKSLSEDAAVVELLTCHGEPVDELRSSDPKVLGYLSVRPTSEDPEPG